MNHIQQQLLAIVRFQLFGGERPRIDAGDTEDILREATAQTVFTAVFPFVRNSLKKQSPASCAKYNEIFLGNVMLNTHNFLEHAELHRLMTARGVPYCAIKGIASAHYYPEASLRDMGDVDYLVPEADFERAKQAAADAGFTVDHGDFAASIHTVLKRKPMSVWEQHRGVNGIPKGAVGERVRAAVDGTVASAVPVETDGAVCLIPDAFHHGLIMLLHVISHLTSEGIGLRHLCDWAVFAQTIDNETFTALFEEKLRDFGIWRFAQILTLVSERFLGSAHREWAENAAIDGDEPADVMEDILNGGNFGKKDRNRYRETKYIAGLDAGTVDSRSIASQAVTSMNQKVCADFAFIRRHKLLLPVGWVAEGGRYAGMLLTGKRKSSSTSAMLKEAAHRKELYSRMRLFEPDVPARGGGV